MKNAVESFITRIYSKRYTRSEQYFKGALEYALGMGDIDLDEYIDIAHKMGFSPTIVAKDALALLGRCDVGIKN